MSSLATKVRHERGRGVADSRQEGPRGTRAERWPHADAASPAAPRHDRAATKGRHEPGRGAADSRQEGPRGTRAERWPHADAASPAARRQDQTATKGRHPGPHEPGRGAADSRQEGPRGTRAERWPHADAASPAARRQDQTATKGRHEPGRGVADVVVSDCLGPGRGHSLRAQTELLCLVRVRVGFSVEFAVGRWPGNNRLGFFRRVGARRVGARRLGARQYPAQVRTFSVAKPGKIAGEPFPLGLGDLGHALPAPKEQVRLARSKWRVSVGPYRNGRFDVRGVEAGGPAGRPVGSAAVAPPFAATLFRRRSFLPGQLVDRLCLGGFFPGRGPRVADFDRIGRFLPTFRCAPPLAHLWSTLGVRDVIPWCGRSPHRQIDLIVTAPKLGLGGGRLCGRGTAGIVLAPHVLYEVTLVICPVCTFLACVWFDARVRPHVPCECTLFSCPVCTFVACVWFDARVPSPHVHCESTLSSCPVCTFLACVWFDARVRPHVPCESTLFSCPVCTFVACVWFDARPFLLPLLRLLLFRLLFPSRRLPLLLTGPAAFPLATGCSGDFAALSFGHREQNKSDRDERRSIPGNYIIVCIYLKPLKRPFSAPHRVWVGTPPSSLGKPLWSGFGVPCMLALIPPFPPPTLNPF